MRFSYLILIITFIAVIATGIPEYRHEAVGVAVVSCIAAVAVWLYEQKQLRGWPFKRGYTGR